MYNHKKQEWDYVNNHWDFWEPMEEWYKKDVRNLAPYSVIDHVLETEPKEKWGAYLYHLFPSVLVTETEGTWSTFVVTPLAPNKSIITIRSRIQATTLWKTATQSAKVAWAWSKRGYKQPKEHGENDPLASGDFMAEDIYACEQQQKAMNSPMYSQGPSSKDEGPILGFHEAITKYCPVQTSID